MDIDQLIGKFYNRLKKADIAGTEGKVAVQFNLTGKITGCILHRNPERQCVRYAV